MNVLVIALKVLGGLTSLVFESLPPPDPTRRERRDAARAKSMWWSFRRRVYLETKRGVGFVAGALVGWWVGLAVGGVVGVFIGVWTTLLILQP